MRFSRKHLFRDFSFALLRFVSRATRLRNRVVSLMYHEVLPDDMPFDAWHVVRESDFHAQMRYLREHFEVVSLDEAYTRIRAGAERRRPMALVTFDDGYRGNRDVVWPIAERLGIPVTIFVAPFAVQHQTPYWYDRIIAALIGSAPFTIDLRRQDLDVYRVSHGMRGEERWVHVQRLLSRLQTLAPEPRELVTAEVEAQARACGSAVPPLRSLTIEDVRAMAGSSRIAFGAHSLRHDALTQMEPEQARESIVQSKLVLEDWTGLPIRHFAYPYGFFDATVVRLVREAGFVTSHSTLPGFWREETSLFEIPRLGIGRYDAMGYVKARLSRLT
jgi:peptidoglycan/xylan/chitin deacetylase (PgdA/CDA1 family)